MEEISTIGTLSRCRATDDSALLLQFRLTGGPGEVVVHRTCVIPRRRQTWGAEGLDKSSTIRAEFDKYLSTVG
jgi:hypothetical protein